MIYNYYRNERKVIVMWKVYRYAEKDIVSEYGDIIYPAGTWYSIGSYDDLFAVTNIINHEIYLYNCTCKDGDPNPKFKILSDFE